MTEMQIISLLQDSSCFRDYKGRSQVCHIPPCACAQTLHDEIAKPLLDEIERLRAALKACIIEFRNDDGDDEWTCIKIARAVLGQKEAADE